MDPTEQLVKRWSEAYHDEVLEFARPEEVSNEEVFADVYHSLIHSPLSATLLQLEHSHAATVEERCRARDTEMAALDRRQASEMAAAVDRATGASEEGERSVNKLSALHWDERQMANLRWESEIGNVRDTLCREFKTWVMCVHEEFNSNNKTPDLSFPRSESSFSLGANSTAPVFQESFTITLGAQLKQMHNLRIVAADPLDLCRYPNTSEETLPQRLQTAMSLYSNNLCGMVLLTDNRMTTFSGIEKDFAALCQRSPEFHFPTLDQQLESLKNEVKKALEWREEHKKKIVTDEIPPSDGSGEKTYASNSALKNGDFYLTRHSNLCEVHVIFHMICDDSVLSSNINSRHPVIMGLRNVLRSASLGDITTLTIPLLLTLEMTEEMTVQWCMKRAELVFKCVKGFMMEVASWGGAEIKTLQFLVPKNIDQDVFTRLAGMLPQIFRTSNPIRGQ